MDFYAVLDQILAFLRQCSRVSYRALKRQFDLDDLTVEIIDVHQCAVDEGGSMLVWTGAGTVTAVPEPVPVQTPLTHMGSSTVITHAPQV